MFLIKSFLRIGEPEIAVVVDNESEGDEEQGESGEHHLALLRLRRVL